MNNYYLEVLGIERENYTNKQLEELCKLYDFCKCDLGYNDNQIYLASDYPMYTNGYELVEYVNSGVVGGKFGFALAIVDIPKHKGEYESTYDRMNEYSEEKRKLEERLAETTDSEERDFISEQISNCEISIGECEGYLRELDYIDNGTEYW